jgi:GNAT superfamily N-acetyltransferase
MPESRWRIEPLRLEDCAELGRAHVQVWRDAYADHMPADYLAGLSAEGFVEGWRRRAEAPEPGTRTLVARDQDGRVAGFVSVGPSRDEDAPALDELYALNVVATALGSGLAQALLEECLGDRDATLWVVAGNVRARAFYARNGFVIEGARSVHEATGTPEVRMIRSTAGTRFSLPEH